MTRTTYKFLALWILIVGFALLSGIAAERIYAQTYAGKECPGIFGENFHCPIICVQAGREICGQIITKDFKGQGQHQKRCEDAQCEECQEATIGCRYRPHNSEDGTCTDPETEDRSFNCWQICG